MKIDKWHLPKNEVHIFTHETGILNLCRVCQDYSKSLQSITGENVEFYVDKTFTHLYANNVTAGQSEFYTGLCNGFLLAKNIYGEE